MISAIPHFDKINGILRAAQIDGKIYAFGSRAKGNAHKYSDVDLLIDGPIPLSLQKLAELETLLDESDLPFRVDIVDARRSDPAFLAAIKADCLPWDSFRAEQAI